MVFRRFRLNCIVRVVCLALTTALLCFLIIRTTLYASMVAVSVLIAYQVYALIAFVERTNRDLARFLEAIEYSDFTEHFSAGLSGPTFDELGQSFSRVLNRFLDLRQEREESFQYLRAILQHVGIGLIAFNDSGEIELVNNAARRLLRVSVLTNVDRLVAVSDELVERLRHAVPGQRQLVTIKNGSEAQHLSVLTTILRLGNRHITLASFQNITAELDAKEMEAWRNLIRVMTHEIRNSLTPITSLATTVENWLLDTDSSPVGRAQPNEQEVQEALRTIRRRCEGLLSFVDSYRRLSKIPQPSLATVSIKGVFEDTCRLIQPRIEANGICISSSVEPDDLAVQADPHLLGQVLMNLLLNAVEALQGQAQGWVKLGAWQDGSGQISISVSDNGPGIVPEALDQVFVPFYTTKRLGSGIGLSLSRQIMRLHRGSLTVTSEPSVRTTFTMRF